MKNNEYTITFAEAKNMEILSIKWVRPFEEIKEAIENYYKTNDCKYLESMEDVLCVVEFGSIDIEFQIFEVGYDENDEENSLDIGFFVCVQRKLQVYKNGLDNTENDGWDSLTFSDMAFDLSLLDNKENFEEEMFNELIRVAKAYNLTWSERN